MRTRIKKLSKKEVELIGILEERKATLKTKAIRSIVNEGMSFKEAKRELRFRIKLSCIKRAFQELDKTM
jgi:hypothetical protein